MFRWYVTYNFYMGGAVGWHWQSRYLSIADTADNDSPENFLKAIQQEIAGYHAIANPATVNIIFILELGEA